MSHISALLQNEIHYGTGRRKGSKVHIYVDTLGRLLALLMTTTNEQERAPVGELALALQEATRAHIDVAFVDQNYTTNVPATAAAA